MMITPLSVTSKRKFQKNYNSMLYNDKLLLFACDQRIEHLHDDFYGPGIHKDDAKPDHYFNIASKNSLVMMAQLGLITRYAEQYKNIKYVVKLNSKTSLTNKTKPEQYSGLLNTVDDVLKVKTNIVGVAYTIYLGSEYEDLMLSEAAKIVQQAHQNNLVAMLLIYPRGKAVKNEIDRHLLAGAVSVANCLGADFVKINPPKESDLSEIIDAAGNTKVVFAGGKSVSEKAYLEKLKKQLKQGIGGCAVGRNIHQKSLADATKLVKKIFALF
jgi:fructose-bisphosphate aldolase / 6-deoxy-5-ketofructose 1-phosphate synthase